MTDDHPGAPSGIDREGVTRWFEEHVDGVRPPLSFELIAGGRSNLTYTVTDDGGNRWVLRRPPLGKVLATAHDMGREHRIISALGPTAVPVPPTVGLCDDDSVTGAPFYVMDFVDGIVLRDQAAAESSYGLLQRKTIGDSLVDVLAEIHEVNPEAVGLGDLGRTEGYVERQLKRWYKQFQQSKMRDLPAIDEVYERLIGALPVQQRSAIVHGDYRLDNCLLDSEGHLAAVLDWELCTLGDPLADVGLLLVYWADPGDPIAPLGGSPTLADGFPRRSDLLDRYAERSGLDLSGIDYYVALGYWKLACILEGVAARYAAGVMGDSGAEAANLFEGIVAGLAEEADRRSREIT